jgi:hypothetical protein
VAHRFSENDYTNLKKPEQDNVTNKGIQNDYQQRKIDSHDTIPLQKTYNALSWSPLDTLVPSSSQGHLLPPQSHLHPLQNLKTHLEAPNYLQIMTHLKTLDTLRQKFIDGMYNSTHTCTLYCRE